MSVITFSFTSILSHSHQSIHLLLSSVYPYIPFVRSGDATVPPRKGCIRPARTCRCGQTQSRHPSSTEGTYVYMYVCTCTLNIIVAVMEHLCCCSYNNSFVCLRFICVILLQSLHLSLSLLFSLFPFPLSSLFPFFTQAHTHTFYLFLLTSIYFNLYTDDR